MLKVAYFAGVMMLVASPVMAQSNAEDTTKNVKERVICQKEENIGSRLGAKKICLTAKEWKERAAGGREETERVQMGTKLAPAS
ncbi:MAG: hypothetical protein M3448_09080 [Pseudomonadota bacterium]|nr:hypothetical protein [Sphingomonas sp.]MDQ3483539.1 hypothetical protein [Pseudomonadota bacterium]